MTVVTICSFMFRNWTPVDLDTPVPGAVSAFYPLMHRVPYGQANPCKQYFGCSAQRGLARTVRARALSIENRHAESEHDANGAISGHAYPRKAALQRSHDHNPVSPSVYTYGGLT